jgi:tripartite-type tricarboxylate transporter receptor subunit TctC
MVKIGQIKWEDDGMTPAAARRVFIAISLALVSLTPGFAAADDYPTRPITLVVPYPPGGGIDVFARLLQNPLEQRLGKPIVVENRPGGGTTIGAAAVAKAEPDGYTLLYGTPSSLAVSVAVFKSLSYDPAKDFTPIVLTGNAPFVLLTTPSLPVKNLADLIKLAKEKPGQISFASGGPGSPQHLFMELMRTMAGLDMVHVPYRGDGPILTDLTAGHIPIAFCELGVSLPFIKEGKVRALAVSSATRVPAAPDIPTVAEAGVPGFDAVSWQMIVAPAGTPAGIVNRLHKETKEILASQEMKDYFVSTGRAPVDSPSPAALADYVKAEIVRWSKVVEAAGIAKSQ